MQILEESSPSGKPISSCRFKKHLCIKEELSAPCRTLGWCRSAEKRDRVCLRKAGLLPKHLARYSYRHTFLFSRWWKQGSKNGGNLSLLRQLIMGRTWFQMSIWLTPKSIIITSTLYSLCNTQPKNELNTAGLSDPHFLPMHISMV